MHLRPTLFLLGFMTLGGSAAAHGDAPHKKPAQIVREQKAWGIAGDARQARRTITIAMSDRMRFTPDTITVKQGETVRLVFHNQGRQLHEFVLGTRQELQDHAALMLKFPDMEHDEPYMAHVPAGKTAQIVWTFNRAGSFDFGCLIPGHFQAGMVGQVHVQPQGPSAAEAQALAPAAPPAAAPAAPPTAGRLSEGEIRTVDQAARTLTIRHGDIPSLGMGPMTMVFGVKRAALLKGLKAGDRVRFAAEKTAAGYVVTELHPAP